MKINPTIYIAAAMFNSRETLFNSSLEKKLCCDTGSEVILPQRDGLEFTRLANYLSEYLPQEEVMSAAQNIIYTLDIGRFIPLSDVVIANFDEPIDEGMLVEVCYAKQMGRKIIGLRSDTRSPYGSSSDPFRGTHAFAAYQSDIFISSTPVNLTNGNGEAEMESLAQKIRQAIIDLKPGIREEIPKHALEDPAISDLLSNAKILFEGISDYNFSSSLSEIAKRYLDNRQKLETQMPRIMN